MKTLSHFSSVNISKEAMKSIKGGKGGSNIFCEWYVGYTEANGISVNPDIMQYAMQLDMIVQAQGYEAAYQNGGQDFYNTYPN